MFSMIKSSLSLKKKRLNLLDHVEFPLNYGNWRYITVAMIFNIGWATNSGNDAPSIDII